MEKGKVNISAPGTNSCAFPQLSFEEQSRFIALIKIGVSRELYRKNMLTQEQLSALLQTQNNGGAFSEETADMEYDARHKRNDEFI